MKEADAVYVCLCNGLTDSQVRQAAEGIGVRPSDLYAACGCRAQCGQCVRTLLAIARDVPNLQPEGQGNV